MADGSASFTFSRSSRQISVYFSLKSTDRAVLEAIKEFMGGAGRIYPAGVSSMYRVNRREELGVLVNHFDAFPLQSHKRDGYAVWRNMVMLKQEFRRRNKGALERLAAELSMRGNR